jgi:hypothetical protein
MRTADGHTCDRGRKQEAILDQRPFFRLDLRASERRWLVRPRQNFSCRVYEAVGMRLAGLLWA